jgi:capsular exopolysaccharide synthesis family protein
MRDYLRVVTKRKWYLVLFASATVAAVSLWTLRQPPIYRATATIVIDATAPAVLGRSVEEVVEDGSGDYWSDQEYYSTQYRVLESRTVAEGVVKVLGLQHNPDFLGVPRARRRGWRGVTVTEAAGVVQASLTVQPVKNSRLVEVRFEDQNPKRAALVANTLADVYRRHNLDYKLASTVQALDWLSQQLDELRTRLEGSEVALHNFIRDNNVLSLSMDDRQKILTDEIAELNRALTTAKTEGVGIEARLRQLQDVGDLDPLELPARILLENPTLISLKTGYARASEEQAGLASRYGDNHPASREASAKVASIRQSMAQEIRSVVGSVGRDLRANAQSQAALQGLLDRSQAQALQLNLLGIAYDRLEREEKNNEEIYGLVLKRTKETDLSKLLRTNNIRVLDSAMVPGLPVRPNLRMNLTIALFLGILGGLALCFLVERLDNTLKSKEETEAVLAVPFLGLIPRVGTGVKSYGYAYGYRNSAERKSEEASGNGSAIDRDTYVATHPKSAIAECCRSIRTNLLFLASEKPLHTLLVTSSAPQEGKTSTSVSMAITMAQGNNRTLLIDTDMRRPRVHKVFGIGSDVGISSVIIGTAELSDAIKPTAVDNLWVLPCGPIPPNPAELLHTEAFRKVLASAGQLFDRVVLDSPPVTVVTDASIIGTMVDGVLLVVRAGKTIREAAKAARYQLTSVGARVLGVVLNDVDLSQRGGDPYHQHYYYYSSYGSREPAPVVSDSQEAEPPH